MKNTNTITNKIALEIAIATLKNEAYETEFTTDEVIEKLNKMLETARKPHTAVKKENPENDVMREKIYEFFTTNPDEAFTATMVANALGISSCQKASALIGKLIDEKKVERFQKGKSVTFALAK